MLGGRVNRRSLIVTRRMRRYRAEPCLDRIQAAAAYNVLMRYRPRRGRLPVAVVPLHAGSGSQTVLKSSTAPELPGLAGRVVPPS